MDKPIRLFVTDVDGCVSHPFRPPPLDVLARLIELHNERQSDPCIPALSLCTGRPLTYAEAVAQWLAVDKPFLFESGAGMYDLVENQVWWSRDLSQETEDALADLRRLIQRDVVQRHPGTIFEFAKLKDIGVVNPNQSTVENMLAAIHDLVAGYPNAELEVHSTSVSVNVIPRAANKGVGIAWLAAHLGLTLDEVAYIGDSSGDLSALARVALPFAPANAIDEVKDVATVTKGEATDGLLEAYIAVIEHNRRVVAT